LIEDSSNPYQPPPSHLVESAPETTHALPQKARPLFRFFAGIIGIIMVVSAFGRFEPIGRSGFKIASLMMALGAQFLVASLSGHWYSWFGRRL
jgi:hypothetical protein